MAFSANWRGLLAGSSLMLLLGACGVLPLREKDARQARCSRTVDVFTSEDHVARPHRVVRRVSASCAQKQRCVAALVARACELKADAVIVDRSSVVHDSMAHPTYGVYHDPQSAQRGEAPIAQPAAGAPNLEVADGRLIEWLDRQ